MQLTATIHKVLYPVSPREDGSSQWFVLSTTAGKIVGSTRLLFKPFRAYVFEGDFTSYQGQLNFKFSSVKEDIPTDPRAILDYACSITSGIGNAFADKVWATYGERYEAELLKLSNPSVRESRLIATLQSLKEDYDSASAVADLMAHGATQHLAESALAQFGKGVASLVRDNLYVLTELQGQSFKTIDERFREAYGIELNDRRRVTALIMWLLRNLAEESGDTVIELDKLIAAAAEHNIDRATTESIALYSRDLHQRENRWIMTKDNYTIEQGIHILATEVVAPKQIDIIESELKLDESQRAAVQNALNGNRKAAVINGGAGCGKTTIIKTIAQSLEACGATFNLCAFAGKAAARVREATGFPASTIHSMLQYQPERGFALDTLAGVWVIVDEASMVPSNLLYEICKRRPERLILVGDEAQLPPVGCGAPFHDLVNHGLAKTVTTCYRNKEAIFQAAYAVRNGDAPVSATSDNESFKVVGVRNADQAQEYIAAILQYLDFDRDIIIAPRNGSEDALPASVAKLNRAAMQYLGFESHLEPNARIICTKNNPAKDVWNGTTGIVKAVDIDGNCYVEIDTGKEVQLPATYCSAHTAPAYALSIHKSQGSQYRYVVIVCLRRDIQDALHGHHSRQEGVRRGDGHRLGRGNK